MGIGDGKPLNNWSKQDQPEFAHKDELISRDNADEIKDFIKNCGFSTKTVECLNLILSNASGKEFRTANYSLLDAQARISEFKIWLIEQEVLLPREDRDRLEFKNALNALTALFLDNLSQCTRDEFGRNVMLLQYVDTHHESAEVNQKQQLTQLPMQPTGDGFRLRSVPVIGGLFK